MNLGRGSADSEERDYEDFFRALCTHIPTPPSFAQQVKDAQEAAKGSVGVELEQSELSLSPSFAISLPREILERIFNALYETVTKKGSAAQSYVAGIAAANTVSTLSRDWRDFGQALIYGHLEFDVWFFGWAVKPTDHRPKILTASPDVASLVKSCKFGLEFIANGVMATVLEHCPNVTSIEVSTHDWDTVGEILVALSRAACTSLQSLTLDTLGGDAIYPFYDSETTLNCLSILSKFSELKKLDSRGPLAVFPLSPPQLDAVTRSPSLPLSTLRLEPEWRDAYPWEHTLPNFTTFFSSLIQKEGLRSVQFWANPEELALVEWLKQPGFQLEKLYLKTWEIKAAQIYQHAIEFLPFHQQLQHLDFELAAEEGYGRDCMFSAKDAALHPALFKLFPSTLIHVSFPWDFACETASRPPRAVYSFLLSLHSHSPLAEFEWSVPALDSMGLYKKHQDGRVGWGVRDWRAKGHPFVFADGLWETV
ncbi:hypothetical protein JCM8097_000989 [Rhodosporidiobolus ruineniae]